MDHEAIDCGLPRAFERLIRVCNDLSQRLNQRLHTEAGISLVQYQFLCAAASAGPLTLSRVAGALGCTRGNVTGLADRLAEQGLIGRQVNPDDRRSSYVVLTEAGRERLGHSRPLVDRIVAEELRRPSLQALLRELVGEPPSDRDGERVRVAPEHASGEGARGPRTVVTGGDRSDRVVIITRDEEPPSRPADPS